MWVVNRGDGTLSRVIRHEHGVRASPHRQDPTGVAAGAGAVWVAGGEDGTVVRVDPRDRACSRRSARQQPVRTHGRAGSVWTATTATAAAHRGGTLRLVIPDPCGPRELAERRGYSFEPGC